MLTAEAHRLVYMHLLSTSLRHDSLNTATPKKEKDKTEREAKTVDGFFPLPVHSQFIASLFIYGSFSLTNLPWEVGDESF